MMKLLQIIPSPSSPRLFVRWDDYSPGEHSPVIALALVDDGGDEQVLPLFVNGDGYIEVATAYKRADGTWNNWELEQPNERQ